MPGMAGNGLWIGAGAVAVGALAAWLLLGARPAPVPAATDAAPPAHAADGETYELAITFREPDGRMWSGGALGISALRIEGDVVTGSRAYVTSAVNGASGIVRGLAAGDHLVRVRL